MKALSSSTLRLLIRIAYLLPAIGGLILLIYALIPHIYFIYDGAAYETLSTFTLVGNTFSDCSALLDGTTDGSNYAAVFSYLMIFFGILFWIGIICYTVMAASAAICSCLAFSQKPTAKESNQAKRWFRFFCPNRGLYIFSNLLILLSAAFPHILLYFYHTQLGYTSMSVHFFGISDLVLAAILVLLNLVFFIALLPAQSAEHLDMYRLYKAK